MSQKETTTVRVERYAVEQVKNLCDENGWSLTFVTTRLLQRFAAGEFSGSAVDVLRHNAGKEPGSGGFNANNGVNG